MKQTWVTPRVNIQNFEANEYVAACWGVGCNVAEANVYENENKPTGSRKTWFELGCSHAADHCGNSGNQVIYDDNNDGTADRMVEVGTDELGTLSCTIYTDDTYNLAMDISSVRANDTIYWTTAAGEKVWHHVGTVYNTVPDHPNRS